MKKVLPLALLLLSVVLLTGGMSGCGSSGVPWTPTQTPTPTPISTPTPSNAVNDFGFLRADGSVSGSAISMTGLHRQAVRRAAKVTHASNQQAALTGDSVPVNIYVWPGWMSGGYWNLGTERKITGSSGAYSAVHVSLNGTDLVYSAPENGYNQIFTTKVPDVGRAPREPLQLTTDIEQHWVPHISADGSRVVFTKFDAASSGDVVCTLNNTAGAAENCLDFSSTTPMLRGANMWHASWAPDGKIFFEAWGGPFNSDEIFMVNADDSGLTQITNNAGSKNYDECPSVSSDGAGMAVDTWNDTTKHYEVGVIDLKTRQRATITAGTQTDAWDPLFSKYALVWVSGGDTNQSLELWLMSYSPMQLTRNTYADYFESSPK